MTKEMSLEELRGLLSEKEGEKIEMPWERATQDPQDEQETDDSSNGQLTNQEINPEKLMTKGIVEAIAGETVKSMVLEENSDIEIPNYLIDLTNIDGTTSIQKMALKSMIHPDGNVPIYIHKETSGTIKLGMLIRM